MANPESSQRYFCWAISYPSLDCILSRAPTSYQGLFGRVQPISVEERGASETALDTFRGENPRGESHQVPRVCQSELWAKDQVLSRAARMVGRQVLRVLVDSLGLHRDRILPPVREGRRRLQQFSRG